MEKFYIFAGVLILSLIIGLSLVISENTEAELLNFEFKDARVVFKIHDPFTVVITNGSSKTLTIRRKFAISAMRTFEITPHSTTLDKVPYDGTEYTYEFFNDGEFLGSVKIALPLSKNSLKNGPFYSYNQVKHMFHNFSNLVRIASGSEVYETTLHGVRIKVAFFPDTLNVLPKSFRERLFRESVKMFHRHWLMYKGFPTKEYRLIFWYKNSIPHGSESYVACHYLKWYIDDILRNGKFTNLEALSHGIGHAWMGYAITITKHRTDVWWLEGFDHFNGIITLDNRMDYLRGDLRYVKNSPYRDMPLIQAGKLFGTKHAYLYYAKVGFVAYLIAKRLKENGKSWEDFMHYLYKKYFLSENKPGQERLVDRIHLNTTKLLHDLEEFSGVDFSDIFDKYVYGKEDITKGLVIEEKFLPKWDF